MAAGFKEFKMCCYRQCSFDSKVSHTSEPNPTGEDLLQIKIHVDVLYGKTRRMDSPIQYNKFSCLAADNFSTEFLSRGELLSKRMEYTKRISEYLSSNLFHEEPIPEDKQRSLIEEIFRKAQEDLAPSSFSIIYVKILKRVDSYLDSAADDVIAMIEGVEKVRVDEDYDMCLKLMEEMPCCIICMGDLIDEEQMCCLRRLNEKTVEEDASNNRGRGVQTRGLSIAKKQKQKQKQRPTETNTLPRARAAILFRLACSHHVHGDCLVGWIKINRVCPLCGSQLGQPPKPPGVSLVSLENLCLVCYFRSDTLAPPG